MGNKRNRQDVQDRRNAKKQDRGRTVNQKHQWQAPKPISAKTVKQKELFEALHNKTLVVAKGPAGTGKTYCSAGDAADALRKGDIKKICVSRPYVGMGSPMGFRPGSEFDKLLPYVLPIFDVFKKRLDKGGLECHIKEENIELVPLETLRGRSFEEAVVIIDEAQNCTVDEMKSIVTRIGENSQLILMGDPKQKDLKGKSGLEWVCDMIDKYDIEDAQVVEFSIDDVVRSDICSVFLRIMEEESDHF